MTTKTDIVISGGGMVGMVAAVALAKQNHCITLLEYAAEQPLQADAPRQLRVSAIAQSHLDWFNTIGIGEHFYRSRLSNYRNMQVWDNASTAKLNFSQADGNFSQLGSIIENQHTVHAATQAAKQHPNIQLLYQTHIQQLQVNERQIKLTLNDQQQLKTDLLLVAEGANSPLREKLGINCHSSSYQQQGLVAYIKLSNTQAATAYQAFNAGGPLGILPIDKDLFSIVWSLPQQQVEFWLNCDENKFCNGLQAHIGKNLGSIELIGERAAFPLRKNNAESYRKGRAVLLGDAAHVVHPLAGQGVNLGLGDVRCLVEQLSQKNLKANDQIELALSKYQRARRSKAKETTIMMDIIHQMFTRQTAPLPLLRSLGSKAIDCNKPLKNWLMTQAGS